MLRARLIGGLPADLVGALTGLTSGRFPVAARARYADGVTAADARRRVKQGNAAQPVESKADRSSIDIFAKAGSPVIAVQDGVIRKVGESKRARRLRGARGRLRQPLHLLAPRQGRRVLPVAEGPSRSAPRRSRPSSPCPRPIPSRRTAASAGAQPSAAPTASAATAKKRAGRQARPRARRSRWPRSASSPTRPARAAVPPAASSSSWRSGSRSPATRPTTPTSSRCSASSARTSSSSRCSPGAQVIGGTVLGRIDKVDARRAPAPDLPDPPGRPRRAADRPQADPRRLEAARVHRDLPRAGQEPVLRRRRQEPDDRPDPADEQGAARAPRARRPAHRRSTTAAAATSAPARSTAACWRRSSSSPSLRPQAHAQLAEVRPQLLSTTAGTVSEHSSGNAVDIAAINGIPISATRARARSPTSRSGACSRSRAR